MLLSKCRCCGSGLVEKQDTRKAFPLFIWPLRHGVSSRLVDISLYVCNECGYIQLQDLSEREISEIYGDEVYNIENPLQNRKRYGLITDDDQNKFNDARVLEVGGGRNSFLDLLPSNAEKWVSDFDVNDDVLKSADGALIGDFIDVDCRDILFDYIFLFHVLEHFNYPDLALRKIRNLLNSNGKLVLEVPNFAHEVLYIPYYTLFHMHVSLFTEDSLMLILKKYGFELTKIYAKGSVLLAEFSAADFKRDIKHIKSSLEHVGHLKANIALYSSRIEEYFYGKNFSKIAIFGGGGSTTLFLYNFPFLIGLISVALDNDARKHGKYLCNGRILVGSLVEIERMGIDDVIVLEEEHIKCLSNETVNCINIRELVS